MKRKPNKNAIPQESRYAVTERSGGRCEFVIWGDIGPIFSYPINYDHEGRCFSAADPRGPHHIERRRTRNHSPENLLDLCIQHHPFVHANPEWAYEHGYMRKQGRVNLGLKESQ